MTPEEFEQLIAQREGETLDFKQEMPSSSDLAKLVTAFYNTRGGTIVFGVEDGTRRLVGAPTCDKETRRQGDKGARRHSPPHPVSPSPCLKSRGARVVSRRCPVGA
ncbi:MAG: ATP-binding protein [Chloroflexi bacterium]|nr:ATP-binding protein [Chloroflexota bacterium]